MPVNPNVLSVIASAKGPDNESVRRVGASDPSSLYVCPIAEGEAVRPG